MNIINCQDLEAQGISQSEMKQSLAISCFNKTFRRSADLPKKFKNKALNLCQELTEKGLKTFITETNYSYTIWQEEKEIAEANSDLDDYKKQSTSSIVIRKEEKSTSYPQQQKENEEIVFEERDYEYISNSKFLDDEEEEQRESEATSKSEDENNINNNKFYNANSSSEEIKKYRGVIVNSNKNQDQSLTNYNQVNSEQSYKYRGVVVKKVNQQAPPRNKRRLKTYRGVTY